MLSADELIRKHRGRGALFDTNLLVLFLVGTVNRQRIPKFKRTQNFTIDDFDLLIGLIAQVGKLVVTPHVLSQVSDLTDLRGKELAAIRTRFKLLVDRSEESYEQSRVLVADPVFDTLGLADAAIAKVCSTGVLVVTSDVGLHLALLQHGADSLNFNHIRQLAWN